MNLSDGVQPRAKEDQKPDVDVQKPGKKEGDVPPRLMPMFQKVNLKNSHGN